MESEIKCEPCDKFITYWIRVIYRNMTNLHNSKLAEYGLTTSQVGVLVQLWIEDGLTQKEIAEELQLRPASITGLVNILVSKGWIDRREDTKDARINRVYLTEEGKNIRLKCMSANDEIETILSNGFSKEEKQLMLCWLKKLNKNLL